jgi:hypothetical protein
MRKTPVILLVLSLFTFLPAQASAGELPGGKANFVVSLGSFKAGRTNWIRLGDYTFTPDGKVRARTYLWQQSNPTARVGTGTKPDGSCSTPVVNPQSTLVRACDVLTVGGFTGAPTESRTGNYRIEGDQLHITWPVPGWNEQWAVVVSPDAKLARLDFRSNALATAGYGYGSNTPLTTRRQMSSVQSFPGTLRLEFKGWDHGKLTADEGPYKIGLYRTCTTTTWCLTYLQPYSESSCKGGCRPGSTDTSIQNFIVRVSNNDRRDTHWQWCSCLSISTDGNESTCYKGNSHVKPMLQILDDDGQFRGWVGAEASFNNVKPQSGDIRDGDMLSAFRVSDFR